MLERIFKERFFTEENGRRVPYRIDRVEIVLYQKPRDIARSTEGKLLFRDLKPYLQIFGYFSVVDRDNWSGEMYKYRDDIPENTMTGPYMESVWRIIPMRIHCRQSGW